MKRIISTKAEEQMVELIVEAPQKIQPLQFQGGSGKPVLSNLSLSYFVAIMCTMLISSSLRNYHWYN